MNSKEIKAKFFNFFKQKNHNFVASAPIVLKDDPTLMFTNAGMNQFKSIFLGTEKIEHSRVYNTQKCLRVSGKHNDLEEVGKDHYHHTMFEMMGNWSFGGYFKSEAIQWAWELLTEVYKINPDNLYATVFEGHQEDGLEKDKEAITHWKTLVDDEKIVLGNKKDNFWEMGEQGPCGPSSEIHIDLRSEADKKAIPAKDLINKDHPEVIEIWNLVFIQFNRKANGSLENLPQKHVDTGMGFERLCRVLQSKTSNYDTDIFQPIIKKIESISNKDYGKNEDIDVAIRVIADHIRAVTFCVADGQLPSSNGAGYVVRRILRRAVRYAYTFLDMHEPFMFKLVEVLTQQLGEDYPALKKQNTLCQRVIKEEEHSFLKTLSQGLKRLEDIIKESSSQTISGYKAFELFDTFGFPIDLTALILSEKGYNYNEKEFRLALEQQKKRSQDASESKTSDWNIVKADSTPTFVGYDQLETQSQILKYRSLKSKKKGQRYQMVFDQTPFYPEGGGQVGDRGILKFENESIEVLDTKNEHGDIIHITKKLPSDIDQKFIARVDSEKRFFAACNHSATHLLHYALREILGSHVEQKGSLVNENYLRFDFSHFEKLKPEEISQIENTVNTMIADHIHLEENRKADFEEAKAQGAMALFGEKYGDKVRTIKFGQSIELCGGTHVNNTSDIWYFKITSQSSVASGVRRIEAITNRAAKQYLKAKDAEIQKILNLLSSNQQPVQQIEKLLKELESLKDENQKLLQDKTKSIKSELKNAVETINGVNFIAKQVDLDPKAMKDVAFQLGGEIENLFLILGSKQNGKAILSCFISKDLAEEQNYNAGKIIKALGQHIHGGGGGQAFFATAGGKNPEGISKALEEAKHYL
ncbi:MAG: alanine--tRNA ligase [Bacteroidetes bacterium]|jgi:alanyl-tRNA synthetase|nr:alanine--tRNA ligase [Bacteroidota bacterium]